jgi:holo-ACP synthase
MGYTADDILLERERRVQFQNGLMKRFGLPLIFMKVNYPGLNKNNAVANSILQNMDSLISDILSNQIVMKIFRITAEGPSVTMIVREDVNELKKTAIQIEDRHTLGRCIDIDVYNNKTLEAMGRVELGILPRKCYICDDAAHNCVRSMRHTQNEIIKFIQDTYKEFMENFYGKKL